MLKNHAPESTGLSVDKGYQTQTDGLFPVWLSFSQTFWDTLQKLAFPDSHIGLVDVKTWGNLSGCLITFDGCEGYIDLKFELYCWRFLPLMALSDLLLISPYHCLIFGMHFGK